MKTLITKNSLIVALILVTGLLLYQTHSYKKRYELTRSWTPPSFCSDENLRAINFLINTQRDNFGKARAVVSLKDNGCFYDYPALVESAQKVVDKENEAIKIIKGTDVVSVEMVNEFETNDPLRLFEPKDVTKDAAVLELTSLSVAFDKELDKRSEKELGKFLE